jgi:hypothetical protein
LEAGVAVVRVQFRRFSELDPIQTWLDGSVLAVSAEPFEGVDSGEGGITRADILDDAMVLPLDTFPTGAEVYVESEDASDCLFDEDPEAERTSHIWWRAEILPKEIPT